MGDLVDALVRELEGRASLRPHAAAVALERAGSCFRVRCEPGGSCQAEAVVLATPPHVAARLLAGLAGGPLPDLDLRLDSLVSVSLALGTDQLAFPEDVSGIVCRGDAWRGLRACTVASAKFPGRAALGAVLLRAFFRPEPGAPDRSDRAWAALAWELLAPPLGAIGSPGEGWVARWPDAIPRFGPGHRAAVAAWRAAAARLGPIALAGAGFDPAGVDGAVGSAAGAAELVVGCRSGPLARAGGA
jgi:oxygen-dependent protoporphyrinogen oxidase